MAQYTVEYGTIWVKDVAYTEGSIIELEEDNAIRIGPQVKMVVVEPAKSVSKKTTEE